MDNNASSIKRMARTLLAAIILCLPAAAGAQEVIRPVTSAFMLEGGGASITNTYLSPLRYSGWNTSFGYERMQAMRARPEDLVMRLTSTLNLDRTENPAKNASMWRLTGEFSWGMARRFRLPYGITLGVGGSTSLDLGCIYSTRNGNNPVAVEAAWTVNVTGYAAWNTRVLNCPLTLRYQPTIPLTGVFFSPEYGELFYEIYLGDTSGLAHAAWWGNYFRMENLLTADFRFGATALRIGLRNNILSTSVNHITTRTVTTSAIIGVSGEWMSINPRKGLSHDAKIISALY